MLFDLLKMDWSTIFLNIPVSSGVPVLGLNLTKQKQDRPIRLNLNVMLPTKSSDKSVSVASHPTSSNQWHMALATQDPAIFLLSSLRTQDSLSSRIMKKTD